MATPRTDSAMSNPLRRIGRCVGLLATVVATAAVAFPPQAAQADPRPSIQSVQRQIAALSAQADRAVEAYDTARIAMTSAQQRSGISRARVHREQAALDKVRKSLAGVLASTYRNGGTDGLVTLVTTSDPQSFLERSASLDQLARGQAEQLAAIATARHRLAAAEAVAALDLSAQKAVAKLLSRQRSAIEHTLAQQRAVLAGLRADERRRFDQLQAAGAAAARASRDRGYASYTGPASGRAAIAVQEAYRKLGDPYQWAAAGPDRFDCSGLTMWVWAKAGVSLPHSSEAQFNVGHHVSRADIQPGDLTFYGGSDIHHVGIYIGGGKMISAPHTGDVVKIQDAFRSDYAGAVRV